MKKLILISLMFSVFNVFAQTQKLIPDVVWYGGKQTAPVYISTPDEKTKNFGKNLISVWVKSEADCKNMEIKFRAIHGAELLTKVEKRIQSCKSGDVFKFEIPFQLNEGAQALIIADIKLSTFNREWQSSRSIRISEASAQLKKQSAKTFTQDSNGKLYDDSPATSF